MSELLILIDELDLSIQEAFKIPMTRKIILEEDMLLKFVANFRELVHSISQSLKSENEAFSSEEIVRKRIQDELKLINGDSKKVSDQFDIEVQANQKALKLKEGANDYADYVLANLQLTLTKMQKNLIHLEKNIESGRSILANQKKKNV